MTKDQLAAKYPTFKVLSEPDPKCRRCKGEGEYMSKAKKLWICLCVCLSTSDKDQEGDRAEVSEMFYDSAKRVGKQMTQG